MNNKKKRAFLRQEWFRMGNRRRKWMKWRNTRGNQSKLRMHKMERGARPHPGWGAPSVMRWLHPSGLADVIVMNVKQLEGMDPAKQAVRIGHGVGNLARMTIQRKAEEKKIKVLNPKKIELRKKVKVKGETAVKPEIKKEAKPKADGGVQ
jgi:large subunit ribosomal protein L32e